MPQVALIVDHSESEWGGLLINVPDFPTLSEGSLITIWDGNDCLFEDAEIGKAYINNRYQWGMAIEVRVSAEEYLAIKMICIKSDDSYCHYMYPRPIFIYGNGKALEVPPD